MDRPCGVISWIGIQDPPLTHRKNDEQKNFKTRGIGHVARILYRSQFEPLE